MEGIIFLLNQAGLGLAQANAEIARLRERVEELEARLKVPSVPEDGGG